MADYMAVHRTNYFKVNDEKKWNEWFSCLSGTEDFTRTDKDGTVWHGFGGYSYSPWFEWHDEESGEQLDGDLFIDKSLEMLQNMLPNGEVFIYSEVGWDKLRYVAGWSMVVTNQNFEVIDLANGSMDAVKKLLAEQGIEKTDDEWNKFRDNMDWIIRR